MSYNIRNSRANDGVNKWDNRKQALANVIIRTNPDVLGTQEVRYDQLKDLNQLLPGYKSYGVGRDNGKHGGEHSAIFYKEAKFEFLKGGNFWLSETPDKPGSKSWDAAITRICSWVQLKDKKNGEVFYVFNTHFDHKGKEARTKSAALLTSKIDSITGDVPVIVTGDFNFKPDSEGYATMVSKDHKQVLQDAKTPGAQDYTDCGFEVSNKNCSRIDYIFFSKQFDLEGYALHDENNGTYYPSDHCAIVAEFEREY